MLPARALTAELGEARCLAWVATFALRVEGGEDAWGIGAC